MLNQWPEFTVRTLTLVSRFPHRPETTCLLQSSLVNGTHSQFVGYQSTAIFEDMSAEVTLSGRATSHLSVSLPATLRKDKVHGGFPQRDEQEHVTLRQRQPGVSAQNRYSSQYFPEDDFGGQELDVEAGMPLWENEKGPSHSEETSLEQPLLSSGVGDQSRFAHQDLLADTDPAAREIDRLNMQAAEATRELESILKRGPSGRPRRRRTSSRVLSVGL